MNNKTERIKYLNKVVSSGDDFVYKGPKFLYKYRPFDEYAFDMLEKNYIYLCPAMDLDDETECMTSIDISDIIELESNNLKRVCVEQIVEMLKPYCTEEVFQQVKQVVYQSVLRDGTVRRNFLLDAAPVIKDAAPQIDTAPFINWLANIPEQLDNPSIKPQMEKLILVALEARNKMGICSLAESNEIDYMWEKYAAERTGYCIEYEMDTYPEPKDILPVIYEEEDKRQTNIVMTLIGNFIGQFIVSMSNNQLKADISQYLRLFLTKCMKWEYQREWRILGNASEKPTAPKITRVIIGENASPENRQKLKDFCEANQIQFIERN